MTTDFAYLQTESIDKWMPRAGIKTGDPSYRMPAQTNCSEGICGVDLDILGERRGKK